MMVNLHRYTGLLMAIFLIIAGMTGGLLAFNQQLDDWLNQDLVEVNHGQSTQNPALLAPLAIATSHDSVISRYPEYKFSSMPTQIEPNKSLIFTVDYLWGEEAKRLPQAPFDSVYVNPYNGNIIGVRNTKAWTWRNLMPKVFELHRSLMLGDAGRLLLGFVALIWTLNCFIGLYLTLPRPSYIKQSDYSANKAPSKPTLPKPLPSSLSRYLKRWRPAWRIRRNINLFKFSYDAHRAFGLWLWLIFFVLAWSSVKFNLNPVYDPVMRAVVGLQPWSAEVNAPVNAVAAKSPNNSSNSIRDSKDEARLKVAPLSNQSTSIGTGYLSDAQSTIYSVTKVNSVPLLKNLATKEALKAGADIEQTLGIRWIDTPTPQWQMRFTTTKDVGKYSGASSITVDALTGEVVRVNFGFQADRAHQLDYWLASLHLGQIGSDGGLGHRLYQVFLLLVGWALVLLSGTGVYIWWRRTGAKKRRLGI